MGKCERVLMLHHTSIKFEFLSFSETTWLSSPAAAGSSRCTRPDKAGDLKQCLHPTSANLSSSNYWLRSPHPSLHRLDLMLQHNYEGPSLVF